MRGMRALRVGAAVGIVALVLAGCGGQTAGTSMVATPAAVAWLPAVSGGGCPTCPPCEPTTTPTPPPPPTPEVTIYDCNGEISTTWWLTSTFGEVLWSEGSLAALRCNEGPAVLIAYVTDEVKAPVQDATVVLWWPDAPLLPVELRSCGVDRGAYGPTNEAGLIGFGLGPGSYYFPPASGPHIMWVVTGDSCVAGLGMVGLTNHLHLNTDWQVSRSKVGADGIEWGFSPGSMADLEVIDGHEMWVIRVP